jgi:hypothetical protein
MNTGIQDAYNLAWKLALVLKHSVDQKILDTYNEERLPNAKRLTATTDRMFNLAAGKDWFVGLIRSTVFPPMAKYILAIDAVRRKFFILISQIGIRYRDSWLSVHEIGTLEGDRDFDVKAGDRMPYFLVDGKSIYDRLLEPKFHLLTFSDGPKQAGDLTDASETDVAEQGRHGELIDHSVIPLCPNVASIFGTNKSFQLLLRPDNYIAFISPDMLPGPLTTYLSRIFGGRN